jgi:hypothetical protein
MNDVEKDLLALKDGALEATRKADGAFYESYLAEDAVAVVPYGVFDKKTIVEQMSSAGSPFKSSAIEDTKVTVLTPESGLVTYRAHYGDKVVFVTTVYAKQQGRWKGVFYQQTPLPTASQHTGR